jgi:hypothetical protein
VKPGVIPIETPIATMISGGASNGKGDHLDFRAEETRLFGSIGPQAAKTASIRFLSEKYVK